MERKTYEVLLKKELYYEKRVRTTQRQAEKRVRDARQEADKRSLEILSKAKKQIATEGQETEHRFEEEKVKQEKEQQLLLQRLHAREEQLLRLAKESVKEFI